MFMNELTWPCKTAESCFERAAAFNSFLVNPSLPVKGRMGEVLCAAQGWQRQLPSPNHGKNGSGKASPPVLGEVQCQRGCSGL